MDNGVIMQYFEWYLPDDAGHWKRVSAEAKQLACAGITAVWLPPAYKGQAGIHDVGYGAYDLYDLGEFDQKGSVPTKYGTKDEYVKAVRDLQKCGIDVYADIVLDHKMGADECEQVEAVETNATNREQVVSGTEQIEAWTKFTFPGRAGKYSDFVWDHTCFDGVDYDNRSQHNAIYNFVGTSWDSDVDAENVNYDYLMGADLSFDNTVVREELTKWGGWYLDMTGVNGFRIDAAKHIKFTFFNEWLTSLRQKSGRELFAVGEYWSADLGALQNYMQLSGGCMSLFDVPLHFKFYQISCNGEGFDMGSLLNGTLVQDNPAKAVTFVENHDTQAGQALQTVVADWFKPLAYAVILLRSEGYPCVFYGDYYGIATYGTPSFKEIIDVLLQVRHTKMYGQQHDYFDHHSVVGWTYEGDTDHTDSGVAVLIAGGCGGTKDMYVGTGHAGCAFIDVTGRRSDTVTIREDGIGTFAVDGGSLSVWTIQPK